MGEDTYEDEQAMMDIDFSDLNRDRKKRPSDPEKWKKSLVFGGAMLCVAILIIVIILFAVDKSTKQPPSPVQTRVKALEEKVARIGGIEESIAKLQGQQEALQKSIARLEGSLESFTKDLRNATRKIEQLKKRQAGLSGQGKKTGLVRKKGASQTRRRYHVVQRGESLYKIAKKYGISLRELYRLNHLSSKSVIYPGQKLVVGPAGKK